MFRPLILLNFEMHWVSLFAFFNPQRFRASAVKVTNFHIVLFLRSHAKSFLFLIQIFVSSTLHDTLVLCSWRCICSTNNYVTLTAQVYSRLLLQLFCASSTCCIREQFQNGPFWYCSPINLPGSFPRANISSSFYLLLLVSHHDTEFPKFKVYRLYGLLWFHPTSRKE